MERLGSILVRAGNLTGAQLDEAVRRQEGGNRLLGDVLLDLKYVTEDGIARALAVQFDVPYYELNDEFRLEADDVRLVPESVARRFCLIPIHKETGKSLTVVMKDPNDVEAIDTVRSLTHMEIHKAVGAADRICALIDRFYREEAHIERSLRDILDVETEAMRGESEQEETDRDRLMVLANDAPVVRFVNLLLMQAVRDRASDIHFEPDERTIRVRLRVDGVLREGTPPSKHTYAAIVTRLKILSNMDISEHRLPLDGRFKFKTQGRIVDVRVSTLPEVHGEKVVLRLLDRQSLVVSMKDIGFDDECAARFQNTLKMPNGIVLLTGPTGSGKTTTLYSALSFLMSPELNLQTVEDPVEYLIPGINQMQIKPAIGLDFASALRSILRQDPDIVMIGEIRDLDTAEIAMRASLTGHLVLSTLHTNDSPSAFCRLRDIGIAPYLITSTVRLVLSQRLVRVICAHCRREDRPDPGDLAAAVRSFPDASGWSYFRGRGCIHCSQTGYKGRTAIFEFLELSDALRELIHVGTGEAALRSSAIRLGMETLLVNGLRKVKCGHTTLSEVLSVSPLEEIAHAP
jgi:type IV pilus assembly protein PilB